MACLAPRRIAGVLALLAVAIVVAIVLSSGGDPPGQPSTGDGARAGEISVAEPGSTAEPVRVAISRPGDRVTLSFEASEDDLIAPDVRNVAFPAAITIVDPADETILGPWEFKTPTLLRTERCESPAGCQPLTVKRSGTHKLTVEGDGDSTGSFDLRLYGVAPDDERDTTVGGPVRSLDLGVGQLATVTFPSAPGRVVLRITDIAIDAGYVSVRGPGESVVLKETGFFDAKGSEAFALTLPREGSYVVYLRGNDLASGAFSVEIDRP